MLHAKKRGECGDARRVVISGEMEGDTVSMVVKIEPARPTIIYFNSRLVAPDAVGMYARAATWAETTAVVCSDPVCVLRLADL